MTAEPWWSEQAAGLVGGLAGAAFGVWGGLLGALAGTLVPKGKGRGFLIPALWVQAALGAAAVAVGLVGLLSGQPYAVWYPLLLVGLLAFGLGLPFVFVLRTRYRDVELRKMRAEEMG